jgi:organic hydroperoxide reductase OsmC/OhrA
MASHQRTFPDSIILQFPLYLAFYICFMKEHKYNITTTWTGNQGEGTTTYKSYKRKHIIHIEGKVDILGSSMPLYHGDADLHNPEDLLMGSVSACHMLWYLHLCATASVIVTNYEDHAEGTMVETADGSGHFTSITLKPIVIVADPSMIDKANALHKEANKFCFIAQSVNFPVYHEPECKVLVS